MRRIVLSLIVCWMVGGVGSPVFAATSQLWGANGENFDPRGRLPDYSYAGYHAGEQPIPSVPVVSRVTDYGAVANDSGDDTSAFRQAIAATENGAIGIPAGRYILSDIIRIEKSNLVLRGLGSNPESTVLHFTRGGRDIPGEGEGWQYGRSGLLWVGYDSPDNNPTQGSLISAINREEPRGDQHIRLNSTQGIEPGDFILLAMDDDANRTLGWHLHAGREEPGDCSYFPIRFRWPVQVTAVSSSGVVDLKQPLRFDVRHAWNPRVYAYEPVEEVGVENVMFDFPDLATPEHQEESGFNPLVFHGALNSWARDIVLRDADNGISIEIESKNITVQDYTVLPRTNSAQTGSYIRPHHDGHHGISVAINAHDNLVENFRFDGNYMHDITLEHQAAGNVFRNGSGAEVYFDLHGNQPFANLFSNVHVGTGYNVWFTGGGCGWPSSAAWGTFWNIRSNDWNIPTPPQEWFRNFTFANFIPGQPHNPDPNAKYWTENISGLIPGDLHQSQLNRRLSANLIGRIHTDPNGNGVIDDGQSSIIQTPGNVCDANAYTTWENGIDIGYGVSGYSLRYNTIDNEQTACNPAPWYQKRYLEPGTYDFTLSGVDGWRLTGINNDACSVESDNTATCELRSGDNFVHFLVERIPVPGDVDGDGDVDFVDYELLVGNYDNNDCALNLLGSCEIDVFDLNMVVKHF